MPHILYIYGNVFVIKHHFVQTQGFVLEFSFTTALQVSWSLREYLEHLGGLHSGSTSWGDGGALLGACILLKARIHVYHGGQLGTSDTPLLVAAPESALAMRPDLRPVCDLHICNEADVHFNATRREIREGDGGIFLFEATIERSGETLHLQDSPVTIN